MTRLGCQITVNVAPYLATLLDFHVESKNACSAAMVSSCIVLRFVCGGVGTQHNIFPSECMVNNYYLQQLLVSCMFVLLTALYQAVPSAAPIPLSTCKEIHGRWGLCANCHGVLQGLCFHCHLFILIKVKVITATGDVAKPIACFTAAGALGVAHPSGVDKKEFTFQAKGRL